MLAAIGHAQVSGRIGVASVTHDPGLTNAATALVDGVRAGVPLVLVVGDTAPGDDQHLQKLQQREFVRVTGAGFVPMRSAGTAVTDLGRAFQRALQERRPIVFNMPAHLQWERVAPQSPHPPQATPVAPAAAPMIEEAVAILAAARRPIFLAGRGAIAPEAASAIAALARRMQAPLATTLKAQGLFEGEPFNFGLFGGLAHPVAVQEIIAADTIMAFGASLSKHTSENGAFLKGKRVVQILGDGLENPRMGACSLRLIGDIAATAVAMLALLEEAEIPPAQSATPELAAALDRLRAERAQPLPFAGTAPGTLDQLPLMRALDHALPADRALVADLGRFVSSAWRAFPVRAPLYLVHTGHFGAIGCGLGAAIGAAIAAGGRPTILIAGDGGFLMSGLSELVTAARECPNLTILVFNDRCYGAEHIQLENRGMSTALSRLPGPDLAALAAHLGFEALAVTDEASLAVARDRLALRPGGPLLLDLRLDADRIVL